MGRTVCWGALMLLLLLAPGAVSWPQLGGDARRGGFASLPDGPLDIVTPATSLVGDHYILNIDSPGLVATPHGPMGVGMPLGGTEPCYIFRIPDPRASLTMERMRDIPCGTGGRLAAGYDPSTDTLLVTGRSYPAEPFVWGFHVETRDFRWQLVPEDVGASSTNAPLLTVWEAGGFAIDDERRVAVGFARNVNVHRNRLFEISLDDGSVRWTSEVPGTMFATPGAPTASSPGFFPYAPTLLPEGIVVPGRIGEEVASFVEAMGSGMGATLPRSPDPQRGAVAWLSREGAPVGGAILPPSTSAVAEGEAGSADVVGGSELAGGAGSIAGVALGDRLLVVDPRNAAPSDTFALPAGTAQAEKASLWPAVRTWNNGFVVPLPESVSFYLPSAGAEARWTHHEPTGWRVADTLMTDRGRLLVLVYSVATPTEAALVQIDAASGREEHRLPLGLSPQLGPSALTFVVDRGWFVRLMPTDAGVLLADLRGNALFLGAATPEAAPLARLSEAYPAPGEETTLEVTRVEDAQISISWGDGTTTPVPAPQDRATHRYAVAGTHQARAIATFPDGRTATTEIAVHVGATPPPRLSFLQEQLAPERQEVTFFVLGLGITLVGGAFGVYRLRRGARLLRAELAALESLSVHSTDQEADSRLAERRARARGLLVAGRLDAGQLALIEKRIDELRADLRLRIIEEDLAFVSVGMARALRAMLADGRVSRWEREHLLEALDRDGHLTPEQKARVREKIEAWSRRDAR